MYLHILGDKQGNYIFCIVMAIEDRAESRIFVLGTKMGEQDGDNA